MSTIYVDSRRRVSGSDSNFTFELPETLHMQSSAKMAVYKVRIADAFLSTDNGPEPLLDRRGPGHPEHCAAARGRLHRHKAGRVDLKQLRLGHLHGGAELDRSCIGREPPSLVRRGASEPLPQRARLPPRRLRHAAPEHQPPAGGQLPRRGPPNLPLNQHERL